MEEFIKASINEKSCRIKNLLINQATINPKGSFIYERTNLAIALNQLEIEFMKSFLEYYLGVVNFIKLIGRTVGKLFRRGK